HALLTFVQYFNNGQPWVLLHWTSPAINARVNRLEIFDYQQRSTIWQIESEAATYQRVSLGFNGSFIFAQNSSQIDVYNITVRSQISAIPFNGVAAFHATEDLKAFVSGDTLTIDFQKNRRQLAMSEKVERLDFLPSGNILLAATARQLIFFDWRSATRQRELDIGEWNDFALSADGLVVVVAHPTGMVKIFDSRQYDQQLEVDTRMGIYIKRVDFVPQQDAVLVTANHPEAAWEQMAYIGLDGRNHGRYNSYVYQSNISCQAFDTSGQLLVLGHENRMSFWNFLQGRYPLIYPTLPTKEIVQLRASAADAAVLCLFSESEGKLWNLATGTAELEFKLPRPKAEQLELMDDGTTLMAASCVEKWLARYSLTGGAIEEQQLISLDDAVQSIWLEGARGYVLLQYDTGVVELLSSHDFKTVLRLEATTLPTILKSGDPDSEGVRRQQLDPDFKYLFLHPERDWLYVMGFANLTAWDIQTGEQQLTLKTRGLMSQPVFNGGHFAYPCFSREGLR
ncbi:MAG: WD40 repeat domain-containing protein, partial [Bacteroidota bacterium]